jgi:hypothetical protein
MLKQLVVAAAMIFSGSVLAEEVPLTCHASVEAKKLSGAAKASHLKKCEKDAKAACEAKSAEKKIYGAAKASFEKKCLNDAVGTAPEKS